MLRPGIRLSLLCGATMLAFTAAALFIAPSTHSQTTYNEREVKSAPSQTGCGSRPRGNALDSHFQRHSYSRQPSA